MSAPETPAGTRGSSGTIAERPACAAAIASAEMLAIALLALGVRDREQAAEVRVALAVLDQEDHRRPDLRRALGAPRGAPSVSSAPTITRCSTFFAAVCARTLP